MNLNATQIYYSLATACFKTPKSVDSRSGDHTHHFISVAHPPAASVLQQQYTTIVSTLQDPDSVADHFFARGVITEGV